MFNLFKGNKKGLYSPVNGNIVPITEVPDQVFAEKMMGDGFAVIPEGKVISSPCDGEIIKVFKTKHAVILRETNGLEIIIHVGLETVALKGEGFDVLVEQGAQVKVGQALMNVDFEFLKDQGKEIITPVVITNMERINQLDVKEGPHQAGDMVLNYK